MVNSFRVDSHNRIVMTQGLERALLFIKASKVLGFEGIVRQDIVIRRRSIQGLEFIRVNFVLEFPYGMWAALLLSVFVGMIIDGTNVVASIEAAHLRQYKMHWEYVKEFHCQCPMGSEKQSL
jgi:hypothetical protein